MDGTKPSPLGEHHPRCSMTTTTRKTAEKKNILPMELYNLAWCSIYNDHPTENKPTWHHNNMTPYCLLELYNIAHGHIYIHMHMYIIQPSHQTYTKTSPNNMSNIYQTSYQNLFASTGKQWRIHSPHLIHHLPCSFIWPRVLPVHLNLLDCSIPEHEHLSLQYTLKFWLELSIWLHLQYRPVNHMINIFNILLKKWHMENIMEFHSYM